jgi:hypothetical protein
VARVGLSIIARVGLSIVAHVVVLAACGCAAEARVVQTEVAKAQSWISSAQNLLRQFHASVSNAVGAVAHSPASAVARGHSCRSFVACTPQAALSKIREELSTLLSTYTVPMRADR